VQFIFEFAIHRELESASPDLSGRSSYHSETPKPGLRKIVQNMKAPLVAGRTSGRKALAREPMSGILEFTPVNTRAYPGSPELAPLTPGLR
jgi:hypothetical protein